MSNLRQSAAELSAAAISLPGEDDAYVGAPVLEIMEGARNYNAWLARLVDRHAAVGETVIDLGAGRGTIAAIMREHGHEVVCVEPDARQRAAIGALGLVAQPSLTMLPDGMADLVYSLNVLEHVDDAVALLREARRVLKPDGTLVIYVPAFMLLYSGFDRAVGHLRRYTRASLRAEVQTAGFAVSADRYMDCVGFAAALAFKLLRPGSQSVDSRMLIAYDRLVWPVSRVLDRLFGRVLGKNVLIIAHPSLADALPPAHS